MILKEKFKKEGDFLFRYRSYLPLAIIPMFLLCLWSFGQNLIYMQGFTISLMGVSPIFSGYNTALILLALFVGLLGQFVRILVAGYVPRDTSGRNTKEQKANVLNTTGMYSLCRNPLYLGNFLMMLSPIILLGNWLFALVFALGFWLYYERIIYAEEAFLTQKFCDEYLAWAKDTPAFLPNFKAYKKSELDFSMKSMLKREYHSLFGLAVSLAFAYYMIALYAFRSFKVPLEPILTVFFVLCALIYVSMLILVKKTKLFEIEGR
ncbi:methyltransferase family protein [Helicobacter himalayensis]|uniref:methyltransferase family protein n=1 Tax=Helicobacter himalayensis TaxID=1591088 RepID=UPI003D6FA9FA